MSDVQGSERCGQT